ncbi:hypothetical protein KWM_0114630 [Xanthomonas vasicola pv. musacearum NCPPB 2005]|nr:hypothetical protein KWM_0114630 [Xanthomonas vasicola pv. musacearum NCPPB 2005]KFA21248.1 hypothetical protein A11G_0102235 [Xanthomonas vasicola pv. musacearum NCPPB 4392]KFA21648.1 hypothetical protein KWS_0122835 [Xanthomonas vasicola pv. musacearum NCPPB 4384]
MSELPAASDAPDAIGIGIASASHRQRCQSVAQSSCAQRRSGVRPVYGWRCRPAQDVPAQPRVVPPAQP